MPSAIEYVAGIINIVINAGKASVISEKLISITVDNMNNPTTTSAAAVAWAGIIENRGKKNAAIAKQTAVDSVVRPVLPPSATPADDSTKVVIVEVPKRAPSVVPTASDNKAFDPSGRFPSSSSILAFVATPVRVPRVSKISTNKNENKTENISKEKIFEKSSWNAIGFIDGGSDTIVEPSGKCVTPVRSPTIVDAKIPHKRAPLTPLAVNTTIIISAKKNTKPSADAMFESSREMSPTPTMPALIKPISAMNKPIATHTAYFKLIGIALKSASRIPVKDNIIKISPSRNTAVRANCQLIPIWFTTV